MLYYLLVNAAEKKPLLTPLKSFTYQATAKNYINNLNSLLWGLRIDADRKASLFGAVILPSYDGTAIIVSAPGRKPVTGTYGGDVFICTIADFPNACISMTHFTTPGI
ncbi:hypothetical protein RF11_13690 [Thelohanellus kitauei]|uniref:Uncharacterized protein n=1 Tax=Thelohanellus kitauei TaxID=669202 RepID=A0A0C2IZB6_THEKT|nr:hypothetical protein RF11_13690 [Thelohanellus kitauei]